MMIFVAAVLLVVFGLPYLSKKADHTTGEELQLQAENDRIVSQGNEDQFNKFMGLAEQAFNQNELEKAKQNIEEAKKLKENIRTAELEKRIADQLKSEKKNQEYDQLVKLSKDSLEQNKIDEASQYLARAKGIKVSEETEALETQIEIKKEEVKKKPQDQKIDEVYKRYFAFAQNYFNEGNYSKALDNIQKARKLRDTGELDRFESQVKQKITEKNKQASEKKGDDLYDRYFKAASREFNQGKYDRALKTIKQAKEIKNTPEVTALEKEIIKVREGLEKERQRIEKERRKKSIEMVKIINLPPQMINTYNQAIKNIVIFKISRTVKALGYISLTLVVRPNGKLAIQRLNDSALNISPPGARKAIKSRILRKISSIKLSPPIDKNGMSVGVENWRVSYSVGTFRNKIILRRKF